jgi:interferon, gamma-inducible protein 30
MLPVTLACLLLAVHALHL